MIWSIYQPSVCKWRLNHNKINKYTRSDIAPGVRLAARYSPNNIYIYIKLKMLQNEVSQVQNAIFRFLTTCANLYYSESQKKTPFLFKINHPQSLWRSFRLSFRNIRSHLFELLHFPNSCSYWRMLLWDATPHCLSLTLTFLQLSLSHRPFQTHALTCLVFHLVRYQSVVILKQHLISLLRVLHFSCN